MTDSGTFLKDLQTAVSGHDTEALGSTIDRALDARVSVPDLQNAILSGLDQVRHRFMSNEQPLPDLLLSIDTVIEGLNRLASLHQGQRRVDEGTRLVIGVVEGDPHDMGKNIIAAVYRAYGYQVFDLGCQVTNEKFLAGVLDHNAEVLALSAMMSTTVGAMRDIIREVKVQSPDTVVLVGGAPMDENLARKFGADGYAETAVTVLEETQLALEKAEKGSGVRV
jgi:5-methyltetrahydrofolate--homocysteine methyltransferase